MAGFRFRYLFIKKLPIAIPKRYIKSTEEKEYADAFEVIAINRKETRDTIAAYLSQIGDTEGIVFLQDETDQFFTTVTGFAMPESVFYNKEGNIVMHARGTLTEAEMRAHIAAMLAAPDEE